MSADVRHAIASQYEAGLEMLRRTIEACPDDVWLDESTTNRFWHVAYHVLFYVHLYLQPTEADFEPWSKYRAAQHFLGPLPWPPHDPPPMGEPYTRQELLDYLELCRREVVKQVAGADLEADSGFDWLPFGKLELLLYNLRHLQQHVGELSGRLLAQTGAEVDWVGMGAPPG